MTAMVLYMVQVVHKDGERYIDNGESGYGYNENRANEISEKYNSSDDVASAWVVTQTVMG